MINPPVFPLTLLLGAMLTVVLDAGEQQSQKLEAEVRVTMNYLLYLPTGYEKQESWTETYTNPKLYEWFLSHRRAKDQ